MLHIYPFLIKRTNPKKRPNKTNRKILDTIATVNMYGQDNVCVL